MINEHFELNFNDESPSEVVFTHSLRTIEPVTFVIHKFGIHTPCRICQGFEVKEKRHWFFTDHLISYAQKTVISN